MGIYNPRQAIVVTCRADGFDDAVTLSWHSPASFDPFLYSIFLYKERKSLEIIRGSGEFCVNFLTKDMAEIALFCGTRSGHKVNKLKEGKIVQEECQQINSPRIQGCSAYLECKTVQLAEIGDHVMVVGEVLKEVEGTMEKKLYQSNITGPFAFTTTF